jgi:hypothetical protein
MVRKVHKYADGGKVLKDHMSAEKVAGKKTVVRGSSSPASPGLSGAIKDAVGAIAGHSKVGDTLKKRRSRIDQAIEDAGG